MFPSLEWWPDVENNKLENDILENNDQENVDLENDDLENNDLESNNLESVDLEDDDLESEDLECSVFFILCIYFRLLNSDQHISGSLTKSGSDRIGSIPERYP